MLFHLYICCCVSTLDLTFVRYAQMHIEELHMYSPAFHLKDIQINEENRANRYKLEMKSANIVFAPIDRLQKLNK